MIYKFRIISSENDEFIREVTISSHSTFLDLNDFILEELEYEKSQMTSFFLTDQNWLKETEITLIDMTENQNPDIRVMDQTKLGELITEKKQRLLFVFDQFTERSLFLELFEIMDKETDNPKCTRRQGIPPPQFDESTINNSYLDDIDLNEPAGNDEDFKDFPGDEEGFNSIDGENWY